MILIPTEDKNFEKTVGKSWAELRDYFNSMEEFFSREEGEDDEEAKASRAAYAHAGEMMDSFAEQITFPPEPRRTGENREEKLAEIGSWLVQTALMLGCQPELAHQVASIFLGGLRKEWEKD